MLKCKLLVQKSAVTTQYGSGGAPKISRIYSLIDCIAIIIPILPFRHQNGPIVLHSHFHNTCILVLYNEIFQDLYVNNGTNSNTLRIDFDQYEHGEPFITTPVFITWV